MGLDIYLKRYDKPLAEVEALSEVREKRTEEVWERICAGRKYEQLSEAEKEQARSETKAIDDELGLGDYGDNPAVVKIKHDSAKHPEHMFKVGYFRSSYNEGGIQRVLENMLGKRALDYIFDYDGEYHVVPDWMAAADRTRELIAAFDAKLDADGAYRVSAFSHNMFGPSDKAPTDEKSALALFAAERARNKATPSPFGGAYGNGYGDFFLGEPIRVAAMIPGFRFWGEPCVYAIYETTDLNWYRQALEVVLETCEWVLAQQEAERVKYVLHWSG
jgi:hypothetical protein